MSISNEAVQALILAGIPDAQVEVTGDGYKYQATVISSVFQGLNLVKRHQKVYSTLNNAIQDGQLHALTIRTQTPEEATKA